MRSRVSSTNHHGAVIFDGDDTLWVTEELYDRARRDARTVVEAEGIDGVEWEALARSIDLENVAHLGYSPSRFPSSCVEAYIRLSQQNGATARSAADQIRAAAASVFQRTPLVDPHAAGVLEQLRGHGLKLALVTKGDLEVQLRRIETSGLKSLFHVIRVVDEKTPEALAAVVCELGVVADNAWMVGNSLRSDVLPALQAGMATLWLQAHVWEHERTHDHLADEGTLKIDTLGEVLRVVLKGRT